MTDETSDDGFVVGYKKPPRHSRFQPGKSGNPRGKQKGVRNFGTDVKRTLTGVDSGSHPADAEGEGPQRRRPFHRTISGTGKTFNNTTTVEAPRSPPVIKSDRRSATTR
jgi:hypothetical protein